MNLGRGRPLPFPPRVLLFLPARVSSELILDWPPLGPSQLGSIRAQMVLLVTRRVLKRQ